MLFRGNGKIHYKFLEYIGNTFHYSTGFPVSFLTPQNEITPLHEYNVFSELTDKYISNNINLNLYSANKNITNTMYLEHKDTILYYPIYNKNTYLGTILVGPVKLSDTSLSDGTQESPTQKMIVKEYLDKLLPVSLVQLQYTIHLLNLVADSTYYDPTVINAMHIENKMVELPKKDKLPIKISHHNIEQEEKILQYILLSSEGFKDIAIKSISKLSNLVAPPLADNPLRSEKNRFVVGATIVSRAAIKLGLSSQTAFTYSDYYINKMEDCKSTNEVWDLQMSMLMFFRKEVKISRLGTYHNPITKLLINYVHNNIKENISLKNICVQLEIDYKYASNCFKKDTGLGFNKYFTNQKLEIAKKKLDTTEDLIQTISEDLGFTNSYYFSRQFKNSFGISPHEYRKQSLK